MVAGDFDLSPSPRAVSTQQRQPQCSPASSYYASDTAHGPTRPAKEGPRPETREREDRSLLHCSNTRLLPFRVTIVSMPALGEASASDDPTEDVASASLSASPKRTDSFLRASASAGPGDTNASMYFSTVSHVPRRGDCLADTAVSQDFSSVQRSREHGGESEMDAAAEQMPPALTTACRARQRWWAQRLARLRALHDAHEDSSCLQRETVLIRRLRRRICRAR